MVLVDDYSKQLEVQIMKSITELQSVKQSKFYSLLMRLLRYLSFIIVLSLVMN